MKSNSSKQRVKLTIIGSKAPYLCSKLRFMNFFSKKNFAVTDKSHIFATDNNQTII